MEGGIDRTIFRFDAWELDLGRGELRSGSEPVPVERRTFDVLSHLVRHSGELVTRAELLDEVWGDRFVGDSAISTQIKEIRRVLGDDARNPRFVRTVHGRGLRFESAVEVITAADRHRRHGPLPRPRTALVGREHALARVTAQVSARQLTTIVGLGGSGKTRLAAEVAIESADRFGDGVCFVDLVPCHDRLAIEAAIAHRLGLSSADELTSSIGGRELLCILDNCEHVLDHVAPVIDQILESSSGVHVLATSRVPLGILDEHQTRVGPLAEDAAVTLLAQRAAQFGSELDDFDVARLICRRLDGLPLAIELAAAHLRHMSMEDLADRLDRRLDLVVAGSRRFAPRHDSIAHILDDTWDLLDEAEVDLLTQLSVFPSAFSNEDVEQVTGEPTSILTLGRLVDRSLVQREDQDRLRVLGLVRAHVGERCDVEAARRRHAQWCLREVGDGFSRHFRGFDHAVWCVDHYDDLRAASRFSLDRGDTRDAARAAVSAAASVHLDAGARASDALRTIESLLPDLTDPDLVAASHAVGVVCGLSKRRLDVVIESGTSAVEAAVGAPEAGPLALMMGAWAALFDSVDEAIDLSARAEQWASELGRPGWASAAAAYRALFLSAAGRYDEAALVARAVHDAEDGSPAQYGGFTALTALAAIEVLELRNPVDEWAQILEHTPDRQHCMWSSQLTAAGLRASRSDALETERLVLAVGDRLERAGRSPLPDVLVPIAILAYRSGDDDAALRWMAAVRESARPLQSLETTIMYRRLCDVLGPRPEAPLDDASLEAADLDARRWLSDHLGGTSARSEVGDRDR